MQHLLVQHYVSARSFGIWLAGDLKRSVIVPCNVKLEFNNITDTTLTFEAKRAHNDPHMRFWMGEFHGAMESYILSPGENHIMCFSVKFMSYLQSTRGKSASTNR